MEQQVVKISGEDWPLRRVALIGQLGCSVWERNSFLISERLINCWSDTHFLKKRAPSKWGQEV